LCREDALELSSRLKETTLDQDINVFGVIKEVAPIKGAETDEELGVNVFHTKYFNNYPLYLDKERTFYSFLGDKNLLSQPWHSWNPFTLYSDFKSMNKRLAEKGVDGNLKGEGLIKGGILIIDPAQGVVYRHEEQTGFVMPYDEIIAAAEALRPTCKPSA
jgi:hypothetical protein